MNNEFVPYEQSLALKEIGFDKPCFGYYTGDLMHLVIRPAMSRVNEPESYVVTAPLYQQAFRWFREKHNLEYQIIKSANGNYSAVIHLNTQEYLDKISTLTHACLDEVVDCYSYEEAELACLIKLIEIVK